MVGGRDSCFSLPVRKYFPVLTTLIWPIPALNLTLLRLTLSFWAPAAPLSMLPSSSLPLLGNVASLTTQNKLLLPLCSRPLGPAWQCWA